MTIAKIVTSIYEADARSGDMRHNTTSTYQYSGCKSALQFYGSQNFTLELPSHMSDIWISYYFYVSGSWFNQSKPAIQFFDTDYSVSNAIFGWQFSNSAPYGTKIQYWDGSAFQDLATYAGSLPVGSLYRVDMHIKKDGSAGVADVYVNGTLGFTFSGDTDYVTSDGVNRVYFSFGGSGNAPYISAIIIADEDTRGLYVKQVNPTANGDETDWSGSYSDINEVGFSSNAITSGVAGSISTFTKDSLSDYSSGYDVHSAIISVIGSRYSDGVDVDAVVRVSDVNYLSPGLELPREAGMRQAVFYQNPATEASWTYNEINGAEIGVKAVT